MVVLDSQIPDSIDAHNQHPADMKNLAQMMAACLVILLAGCASGSGDIRTADRKEKYSAEQIELGSKVHEFVNDKYGLYADPELNDYVSSVGNKISAPLPRHFKFYILDTPDIQAWAVPGGNIYITRGMLGLLETEDELAAVLSHEAAHIVFRHSDKFRDAALSTNQLGRAIHSHARSDHARQLASEFSLAVNQGYSREQESDADRMALRYMRSAGYDPAAAQQLLRKLLATEKQEESITDAFGLKSGKRYELYSSHPATEKRLDAVSNILGERGRKPAPHAASKIRYLSAIDGMTYGDSSPIALIKPGRLLVKKPSISLSFGKDWLAIPQSQGVLLVQPDKKWLQLIGYKKIKPGSSPGKTFVANLFPVKKGRGRELRIPGLSAYSVDLIRVRNNKKVRARITMIYQGEDAIIILGSTRDNQLPVSLDRAALKTAKSARATRHRDAATFRPLSIRVVKVRSGDSYKSLSRKMPVYYLAEEQLRQLNGAIAGDEVVAGELVKLIQ